MSQASTRSSKNARCPAWPTIRWPLMRSQETFCDGKGTGLELTTWWPACNGLCRFWQSIAAAPAILALFSIMYCWTTDVSQSEWVTWSTCTLPRFWFHKTRHIRHILLQIHPNWWAAMGCVSSHGGCVSSHGLFKLIADRIERKCTLDIHGLWAHWVEWIWRRT